MFKTIAITIGLFVVSVAFAHDESAVDQMPPDKPYVQVSNVLPLPEFISGLGTLFVDPETLPAGPFLGYDRDGKLSATIFMTPLEALENGTAYDDLSVGAHNVTSVDVYYNAGHPGVDEPHAHVVLFHDEDAKQRLAK
ncbi:hypothetical protein EHN06_07600 [Marinobacter sp. NP-4(2019)]|uniref:hypothetical protein n=1 Tax=Marinobacter sp. NP-4(2019) TaxID=2488665 RepID=UPI000FC3DECB|nr:hypothetical protein [Marinobacter sp. NP-4(2019)]AZT83422.1 hypothetical protein EHN06_07600 [Marinobacter sp. NP-4(2019)]